MLIALNFRIFLSADYQSFYQKTALERGLLCCSLESTALVFHCSGIIYKQLVPGLCGLLKTFQHYSYMLSCAAIVSEQRARGCSASWDRVRLGDQWLVKIKSKVIFLLITYSSLRPLLCLSAVDLSICHDVCVMPVGPLHTGV